MPIYEEIYLSTEVYKEIERGLEEGYRFYSGRGIERSLWNLEQANEWLARIVAAGFHSPVIDLSVLVEKS